MFAIDLFSGAGGMTLGAINAGVQVQLAVEADTRCAATLRNNLADSGVFANDIRSLSQYRIRKIKKGRKATVVFGGPPCQGFSYSNIRTRDVANENNWLFKEFLRVVRIWKPDWVVFENVRGIVNTANGLFVESIVDGLENLGYTTTSGLLNASDFGVPQNRARFFLIGARGRQVIPLPRPTVRRHRTVREAIGDLPTLKNGASTCQREYGRNPPTTYARKMRQRNKTCRNHIVTQNAPYVVSRYKHVPQGGNWEDIPARLMKNYADRSRCHTGIYHRLAYDEPSIVIGNFRKNMLIHPSQDRGLSVREAARIQSFPDEFTFHGSIGFQQQQVGNAVPPLLAQAVFAAIMNAES